MRNVMNLSLCLLVLALVSTATGATLYVNTDGSGGAYTSIQAAIDVVADPYDQIEVAPGTYNEAINFKGKAIRLYSRDGPTVTTIDATGISKPVVTCISYEGSGTTLEGFTVTGGNYRGMYNQYSSPTVTNCTFSNNTVAVSGGGWMFNAGANPTVTNCIFSGNLANYGGGMWNYLASPTVTNCSFISNTSINRGSGMYSEYLSYPTVTNCTFISNKGTGGYGMWNREKTDTTVTNCIFWDNAEGQINNTDLATTNVTYSDVQGGWTGTGNIDAYPMFADAEGRLLASSPCIDAGNDAAVPSDVTTDLDGNPRISGTSVDMGAYELSNVAPTVTITQPGSGFVEAVNVYIQFTGEIDDPDTGDTHTAIWTVSKDDWILDIDGSVTELSISNEIGFSEAGIYNIKLTVTDSHNESDETAVVNGDPESPAFVVIYNPDGGFVTGGGWIYSPAGALLDSTAEGKANFGFVAKYKTGATVPTGNTEFRFQSGDFKFKSDSYEWLVVAGSKAMFKGEGFIDDCEGTFNFMLTAVDDEQDKFRIKIWDPATDDMIYDNKRGEGDDAEPTVIGGGSIVIHKD